MSEQAKSAARPDVAPNTGAPGKGPQSGAKADEAQRAGVDEHHSASSDPQGSTRAKAGDEPIEATPIKDPYVQELETKLAEKETRLEATLGQYKEALDEFSRVKARLTRDVAKEIQAGKRSLLAGLLEVVDNLERALDAASGDPAQAQTPLCQGVTMVRDQFHAKLEALGVRKQPALGQAFDPIHFEAISNVATQDPAQDGKVVGVVRDAYVLEGETLRHGIVAVGKLA